MIEINVPRVENIETIQISGNIHEIYGIKTAKSFRGYINGRISHFLKVGNIEEVMKLRTILGVYSKFHPESKEKVEILPWKSKSNLNIIEHPEFFEIIEWRKPDEFSEAKEIKHRIYRNAFNLVYKALQSIKIGKRYKTSQFAEIWARTNHIWENSDGNKIIDNNGFNFANLSGQRQDYFNFYYSIKVLEKHYKVIKYEKSGHITKLKEKIY